MKKSASIFIFLLLFSITFTSANVQFEIKTLPEHEIWITEVDAFSGTVNTPLNRFSTFTGKQGLIQMEYTPKTDIAKPFKLGLLLKNGNNQAIKYFVFDDYFHDGKLIKITFLPESKTAEETEMVVTPVETPEVTETPEENVTVETEEPVVEEEKESAIKGIYMSGHAIFQENKSTLINIITYIFGAIVLLAPFIYFFTKKKDTSSKPSKSHEEEVRDAEEALKKAQARMDELNGKKMEEIKRKLMEDEKELLRLRNLRRN